MQVHTSIRHASLVFLVFFLRLFFAKYTPSLASKGASKDLSSFVQKLWYADSLTILPSFHPSFHPSNNEEPSFGVDYSLQFVILFWLNNIYTYCVFLLIHYLTLYICWLVVSFFKVLTLNFSWFFWTRFNSAATRETIISTHSHKVNCYITIAKAELY